MTMTIADQVTLALHLYDNPELTKLRTACRVRNCKAEAISFYHNGTWYSILKSRGKITAVLIAPVMDDIKKVYIINIGAFDRIGKRHLNKFHEIKNISYGMNIPVVTLEGLQNIC